jgi:hypothetical protein
MVKFKRDLITGLPMSTSTNSPLPQNDIGKILASIEGLKAMYEKLQKP